MKIMLYILPILLGCSSQTEYMAKANGDRYLYHVGKVGGRAVAKSSMGTSFVTDDEKSFQVAAQALLARGISFDQTKVALSKEVTTRYQAGQITIQQRDALFAAIEQSKTSAGLQISLEQIANQ